MSLEESIARRRSVRSFTNELLTKEQIAQIAWSAQGVTSPAGRYRAAPSAGALYPLELYMVTPDAVLRYRPEKHDFVVHAEGDARPALCDAALGQSFVRTAPLDVVIAAVYRRVTGKYGRRGRRYVDIEVGHAGQNILLQAVALGLGAVPVGAFRDDAVSEALSLPADHEPLYIIPIGHPRR